jgi:hypothetical protein
MPWEDSMADVKQRDQIKPQAAAANAADQFDQDLNPNTMAGQNLGGAGAHPEKRARTAKDVKALHARFGDWLDSDLEQVPILPAGSRLEQDAVYVDLAAETPVEFRATGGMAAGANQYLAPKTDVPYQLWNRLLNAPATMRPTRP